MEIRKANGKNLIEIGRLMREEFSKPPFNEKVSIEAILKSLNFYHKNAEVYFAKNGKEIIGVIVFQVEQWWEGPVIIIQDLAVKSGFQNQNVGKSFMEFVEKYTRNKNSNKIYFETNKKSSAINFYKKWGYKINNDRISMSKKWK